MWIAVNNGRFIPRGAGVLCVKTSMSTSSIILQFWLVARPWGSPKHHRSWTRNASRNIPSLRIKHEIWNKIWARVWWSTFFSWLKISILFFFRVVARFSWNFQTWITYHVWCAIANNMRDIKYKPRNWKKARKKIQEMEKKHQKRCIETRCFTEFNPLPWKLWRIRRSQSRCDLSKQNLQLLWSWYRKCSFSFFNVF